jgi:hypothetical protein
MICRVIETGKEDMSTITEDPATTATQEERLVERPPKTVMFMARRSELRLTKIPRYPIRGASGQQAGESPGETICFRDGRLDVDPTGEVELEDGRKLPGSEVLEWLEKHKRLGDVNEGFWKVDHTAPAPSSVELAQLVEAATELDAERLEALIAQEEDGWAREAILSVARGALARVRQIQNDAKVAAQPTPPPDPVEAARAAHEPPAVPTPPEAPAFDEEALAAQYGITVEELRERLTGSQG